VAESRLRRPGWKILAGAALAALLWFGVPRLLGGMAFFEVRRVEVRGARNLRADEIVRALPIGAGRNIFHDLAPIRAAAESIPGLREVRVGRRLPGTIVVSLREADPIALVMRRGQLQLVGERGEVLYFDPTVAAPDLPVLSETDSVVAHFLARAREADATFFARITAGRRVGQDVMVIVDERRYWFRPEAGAEAIRAVLAVEQDLEKKGRRWAELDARYAGQIVVRWESA
jgi:cell division septal protein FtsQ